MTLLIKIVLAVLLIAAVISLFKAMKQMLNTKQSPVSMSHFIGKRLIFSAALMIILLVSVACGWITLNPRPF